MGPAARRWPPSCTVGGVPGSVPLRRAGWLIVSLALTNLCVLPAWAAKNSGPAQVMMLATMPPALSLKAAQATVSGASGKVQTQAEGDSRLLIRGQLRGQGGRAVVRIPVSLAANTRSFVVQAQGESVAPHATIYLAGPGVLARPIAMHGQAPLAMGLARNYGREFFALNRPLRCSLEIVIENLPPGQTSNFIIALSMKDLGY